MIRDLDLITYRTEAVRGGWFNACKQCDREEVFASFSQLAEWQRNHACHPGMVAAATMRKARKILGQIIPDDPRIIAQRRRALEVENAYQRRAAS